MKRYWAMKTFKDWWEEQFIQKSFIGIDQDGIDKNYAEYNEDEIENIIASGISESIERNFRQFCLWMKPGDFVIMGTGQTTKFNISGIAIVTGEYQFNNNTEDPRHIRASKYVKIFNSPRPLQRFSRVARLELIDEIDFHESIISLL